MSSNNRYKLEDNSDLETINSFKILISNIKALKDKTWGCPWQKIQSHVSLIPFLYEESNEFIDAIYEKNADNICEELGDLLLQVMLHAEIGYEEKEFTLNDVIKNLNKKIINRHPYIFNKKEKVSLKKSQQIWENIKNADKEVTTEYNGPIGKAVIFPSTWIHKVEPVTNGERYVLTAWAYGDI